MNQKHESSTRIAIRLSETRSRLNTLQAKDSLDDAETRERDELAGKLASTETEYRAALQREADTEVTVTDTPDAETRERDELRGRVLMGRWLAAAAEKRSVDGAEAEYASACEVPAGHMPLDVIAPAPVEQRAITPGPNLGSTDNQAIQQGVQPTFPAVFERAAAVALGFTMPMVAAGQAVYPSIGTAPPAGKKAKGGAAAETAGAYTVVTRTPQRLTGSFRFAEEDAALFPALESDLRMALGGAMADALDKFVFSESASDLVTQSTDVTADTTEVDWARAVATFAGLVDGVHAYSFGDLRAVIGVDTFAKLAGIIQSAGDMSVFDHLMGKLGGIRVSKRVPAKASDAQQGLVVLTGQGQPPRVPVWSSLRFVVDPYTSAGKAETVVTAISMVGDPVVPFGTNQVKQIHPKLA